jgi:hypothetical protein
MKDRQTSITVSGTEADRIRALVDDFPGTNANRIGRALVRLGLRQAVRDRAALVAELRALGAPWGASCATRGAEHLAPASADLAATRKVGR